MDVTPEQQVYLTGHQWAVLATGRKDGSPQASMIAYVWDGEQLANTAGVEERVAGQEWWLPAGRNHRCHHRRGKQPQDVGTPCRHPDPAGGEDRCAQHQHRADEQAEGHADQQRDEQRRAPRRQAGSR